MYVSGRCVYVSGRCVYVSGGCVYVSGRVCVCVEEGVCMCRGWLLEPHEQNRILCSVVLWVFVSLEAVPYPILKP